MVYDDVLLDNSGDLRLTEKGDIILTNSLVQKIDIQLKWFKGEWPFDATKGTDWFGTVFDKGADSDKISIMIENQIRSFPEVRNVEYVNVEINEKSRLASISWRAATEQDILESEVKIWGNSTASQKMALF